MKKIFLRLFVILAASGFYQNSAAQENVGDSLVTLLFAGDIMGHLQQTRAAYNPATSDYNYDICFDNVKSHISAADISFVNLETTIAGAPYSGYPQFSSPDALLDALKNAGYDVLQIANNHILDRGKKGLERSIRQIKARDFLFMGGYVNKNQRDSIYPLIIEKKGIKIALFNYTYGMNDNVPTLPNIVNMIDTALIKSDLQRADSLEADLKIVTVHWGNEYELSANNFQQNLAAFFVKNDVDCIVGTHPHVVQNADTLYKNDSTAAPVYYSLGNSISNQRKPHTDGGIMLTLSIDTQKKKIINSSYLPVYVHKGELSDKYQFHLIPTTDYLREPEKYKLNKTDSLSLMYFHDETVKRLKH